MRILHSSDWHIGHKLYERSRYNEHEKYFDWLLGLLKEERVDLLLVSGDIFDSPLPSGEATDQYYRFLYRLHSETDAHLILTAGNHDSSVRLAAPREFLRMARIHVVGSLSGQDGRFVTAIEKGDERVTVLAVPYIAEGEILSHITLETQIERSLRYREALKALYQQGMSSAGGENPVIAMGHYTLYGGESGDSERNILLGGSVPLQPADLPEGLCYAALGHLHRAQQIQGREFPIVYSGSPLPMTFKEAQYDKKVFLMDTASKGKVPEAMTVPVFQSLKQIRGKTGELQEELKKEDLSFDGAFIEVTVILDQPVPDMTDKIKKLCMEKGARDVIVVTELLETERGTALSMQEIKTQSPEAIFEAYYKQAFSQSSPDDLDEMMKTFRDLLALAAEEGKE